MDRVSQSEHFRVGHRLLLRTHGEYGFVIWLPKLIENFSGAGTLTVAFLCAIPAIAQAPTKILIASHSDKTGERRWHRAIPLVIGAAFFAASQSAPGLISGIILLTFADMGIHSYRGTFWPLPTNLLSSVWRSADDRRRRCVEGDPAATSCSRKMQLRT